MNQVEQFKLLYEQYMNAPRGPEENAIELKMEALVRVMDPADQGEAFAFVIELKREGDSLTDFPPDLTPTNKLNLFQQAFIKWLDAEEGTDAKVMGGFAMATVMKSMDHLEFLQALDYQRLVFDRIEKFDPNILRTGRRH
jgi:hypothetical protein